VAGCSCRVRLHRRRRRSLRRDLRRAAADEGRPLEGADDLQHAGRQFARRDSRRPRRWGGGRLAGDARSRLGALRGESVTLYDTARGLCHDNLYAVVDDGLGHFWMSAARGIFRVEKADLERLDRGEIPRMSCVAFGPTDGVRSSGGLRAAAACLARQRRRLWFSTPTGLAVVDPGRWAGARVRFRWSSRTSSSITARWDVRRFLFSAGRGDLNVRYTALSLVARTACSSATASTVWTPTGSKSAGAVKRSTRTWRPATTPSICRYVTRAAGSGASRPSGGALDPAALLRGLVVRGLPRSRSCRVVWGGYVMRLRRLRVRELELARRVEEALAKVHVLHGLMPICAWCKRIRDDLGYCSSSRSTSRATATWSSPTACARLPRTLSRVEGRAWPTG